MIRAAALALLAFAQASPWPSEAAGRRVHMIGNAHIDAAWLWPAAEARAVVLSTFRSALDRMRERGGFTFTASSVLYYQWVAEHDPAMFAEIRARVAEGRWSVAGGWWVEPDVNMPSGEALVRQGLYGQRTLARLFGRPATIGFGPDAFGHPNTLPQILAGQGLSAYVMMRPRDHELALPARLFWWEAPDGTRLLTYRIPFEYSDWAPSVEPRLRAIDAKVAAGQDTLMVFYGAGDHGGGPTKSAIASIEALEGQPGAPTVLFSTPERYFAEARASLTRLAPPTVTTDLQPHAVGAYTAESGVKQRNRHAEAALVTAERMAALADVLGGARYPRAALTAAWERALFLQFHDILAGTAAPGVYREAREASGRVFDEAREAVEAATTSIAWRIGTPDPESEYLVVFNPHAFATTLPVEYDLAWPRAGEDGGAASVLEDETGASVAHQWLPATTVSAGRRARILFQAALPPLGYRQFRLRRAAPAASPTQLRADERHLENARLRVDFGEDGRVQLRDRRTGAVVLSSGVAAVVFDDPSDTWSHDVVAYDRELGRFAPVGSPRVLERGPVRATVRTTWRHHDSTLTIDWRLLHDRADLDVNVTLDWHEKRRILKLSFPVDVRHTTATCETPYGFISRPSDGHEQPCQRWIDVSGRGPAAARGLTVINDAKYGYSVLGADLRVSVARGAVYAHHDPRKLDPAGDYAWQDQGVQTFRMRLVPHGDGWSPAQAGRAADELVLPVPVAYQGIHRGELPAAGPGVEVGPANVSLGALKLSEPVGAPEDEDLIVRLVETAGRRDTTATLAIPALRRRWSGRIQAHEILTLRVPRRGGDVHVVDLLERGKAKP